MHQDPNDPSRPELDYVDVKNPTDVDIWTRSLGISRGELERAVEHVGPSAGRVYDYIGRSRYGADK